ncbi:MAG: hypothetical protein M1816_001596 [Peltula sp. TS41687]|nr:MAG: hypothetical protein M1816_001596 [Peltula sp. TS41687]
MAKLLPRPHRRTLIVCCDGTWFNSDRGYVKDGLFDNGRLQVPSNVTRIARAIRAESEKDDVSQVVYYQAGLGTGNSLWEKFAGGATGLGLSENCREAYSFLAHNYSIGDHIILIGWSRGAFTVRSIAGLIASIGLLTKKGLVNFYEVFKDYENCKNPNYRPKFPNVPFENKPKFTDPKYATEMENRQLTRLNISIKAVAVWDTVGSLGLPRIAWLEKVGISPPNKEYAFYDTRLNNRIENAFQTLALDEQRRPFSPAVWEKSDTSQTNLKQVWFPGDHTNVGGGTDDIELSNITLAWMMAQLNPYIDFDPDYLTEQFRLSQENYKTTPKRSWGCGYISSSLKGIFRLAGRADRTPGHYFRVDPDTELPTTAVLENTNEYIHASVRARYGLERMGFDDVGRYAPPSLLHWTLARGKDDVELSSNNTGQPQYFWAYDGSDVKLNNSLSVLQEDTLGEMELSLLQHDPQAYEKVMGSPVPNDIST